MPEMQRVGWRRVLVHDERVLRPLLGGRIIVRIEPLEMQLNSEDFRDAPERSGGLHLSQIIEVLDEARGSQKYPATDHSTRQAYYTVGFMWERILTTILRDTALKARAGVLVRPGEFHLDGIAMSPDAIDLSDYTLEEYKATYLSSSREITDPCYWPWFVQMRCYCRAIGSRSARLRVFYIVGDWKGSGPQMRAWQCYFDEREIEETWAMVLNTAKAKGWL